MNDIQNREDALFEHITKLIETSREQVRTTINTAMVYGNLTDTVCYSAMYSST